jgi:hypothetical protein
MVVYSPALVEALAALFESVWAGGYAGVVGEPGAPGRRADT